MFRIGGSYYGGFTTTLFDTGAASDADSLPTVTATRNGTDDAGFVLTAVKLATGRYGISGTIPATYNVGDLVQVSVAATVDSVASVAIVDSFVVDTPVAVTATAYAGLTGSFLTRAIAGVRQYVDEPTVNAKYTDAVLVEMIEQCYATVIGDLNRVRTTPIVARLTVTMVASQYVYPLPPTIGSIWAMYKEDSDTGTKLFYVSRGVWNSGGRGIWVEGNNLKTQKNSFTAGDEVVVEYVPNGTARLHNAGAVTTAAGAVVSEDGTVITLATPTAGVIDTRANAYVGSIFRYLTHTTGGYGFEQERVITAHSNTAGTITLDVALSPNPHDQTGNISYEIAPAICRGLDHVVALYLAHVIAVLEGDQVKQIGTQRLYNSAIRTLRLDGYNSVLDEALVAPSDGYGNRRKMYGVW